MFWRMTVCIYVPQRTQTFLWRPEGAIWKLEQDTEVCCFVSPCSACDWCMVKSKTSVRLTVEQSQRWLWTEEETGNRQTSPNKGELSPVLHWWWRRSSWFLHIVSHTRGTTAQTPHGVQRSRSRWQTVWRSDGRYLETGNIVQHIDDCTQILQCAMTFILKGQKLFTYSTLDVKGC